MTQGEFGPGDVPARSSAVETAIFTDEGLTVVLYDERNHAVHALNAVSSAIWMLIDGTAAVAEIVRTLSEIFGVGDDEVEHDVEGALGDLWRLGLLEGSPAPSNEPAGS
jgi:PqqD family protein of HPr-rel-A system